jgi:hypothetical protein
MTMLLPLPDFKTEEEALDWWETKFAPGCEAMGVQVNAASLVKQMVGSLRSIRNAAGAKPLTLLEAAQLSNYSPDHLARLIRNGKLVNVGRKHAPRVLEKDLPKRLTRASRGAYNSASDARSLRSRR